MLALGIIALLAGSAYLILYELIEAQEKNAASINISGRQRMLSQKISLLSLQLVNTLNKYERNQIKADITETANLMEKSHNGLIRGDESLNLPGQLSPTLQSMYYMEPLLVDSQVTRYITVTRVLIDSPDYQLSPDNENLFYILNSSQGKLLKSLEEVVNQHQKESEGEIAKLQIIQAGVFGLIILVVIIEAIFIFRPMVRKIEGERRKLAEANLELQRLSLMDGLTGITNRRGFDEHLHIEWRRAMRNGAPISLIMLDIDFFKAYNDTYGHQEGDQCLKKVAVTVSKTLNRATDLAARYGGEEFAVILSHTYGDGAAAVAETLRAGVENLGLEHINSRTSNYVTISLGVATLFPKPETFPAQLIAAADEALYEAKQEGRNRVKVKSIDYQ
ncbi:MAG: diguanylate cyclase [Thermincolia bacterium]